MGGPLEGVCLGGVSTMPGCGKSTNGGGGGVGAGGRRRGDMQVHGGRVEGMAQPLSPVGFEGSDRTD